jgi:hypothetical protein
LGDLKAYMEAASDFLVQVRPDSLTRSKRGSIFGEIWCECGSQAFPHVNWSDFPVVVLSWWLHATVSLLDGTERKVDINFMDGPYEVRLFAKARDKWQAELVEDRGSGLEIRQFEFAPAPLIRSLINCSGELAEACSRNRWTSDDIDSIILYRERLIECAAKSRELR